METKRMFTAMGVALLVIVTYMAVIQWLYKHNNWKPAEHTATTQPALSTTSTSTEPTQSIATASTLPSGPGTQPTSFPTTFVLSPGNVEEATLGSAATRDPEFAMQVKLSPIAAAIESVTLNQFKLKVDKPDPYVFQIPVIDNRGNHALASRTISVDGHSFDLANTAWALQSSSVDQAVFVADLFIASKKSARVKRTYHLDHRNDKQSEGYELTVTLSVENLSSAPIKVQQEFNGPLPPLPEVSRLDRVVLGGYDAGGYVNFEYKAIDSLSKDKPSVDITHSDKESKPLVWAGMGGTYFNCIIRPLPDSSKLSASQYISKVEATSLNPEETDPEHKQIVMTLQTVEQTIAPGATLDTPMKLFFGPKKRTLLDNAYYSAPMMNYDATLVMASGACAFCTFTPLINALVWILIGFHWLFGGFASVDGHTGDWGLAIIAMVCLVRLCLHPIMKRSQVNMMKMSKMGPEMERLKKKFGDDKEALSKAQMEMYKSMGFTPVLGCLPMFLQMPIFIALWQALQSTFELRHAPFLWGITWMKDLSQPDRLIPFGHSIPLPFGLHMDALNLLPLLVAVVSFLNMKYTPRPPAATPEAEQQQKMMQWMTLVFPLMFYALPSGLNLYYLTSTSIGIWEGKRIRAHIKDREEAEAGGRVIVDAAPNPRNRTKKIEPAATPKAGLAGWLSNLQNRVEELRDDAEKAKKKKPNDED